MHKSVKKGIDGAKMLELINNIVWGPATIILVLSCGIYFTLRTNFFQLRNFKKIFKNTIFSFNKKKNKNTVSSFQAVSAALAGTIGTGNIAGVATSISLGGPGSVFWMIVSAFFSMMTKYAEVVLAVKFREKNRNGDFVGGPMYYMDNALGLKKLGVVFAILLAISSFGVGNMVQSNSVSDALSNTLSIDSGVTGFFLATLCGLVILGGCKKILSATEIIVPVMAVFYLLGTLLFLTINFKYIPNALTLIFTDAFSSTSIIGGSCGFLVSKAVKYGISRGVFTNEAGLGSSPVAHACADVKSSVHQGLWGIFEVFFDTVVMCTLTSLVILTAAGGVTARSGLTGINLTIASFETVFGRAGGLFISISMIFFAVATILGWCLYGEKALSYLFKENQIILFIFKITYISAIYIGAIVTFDFVWTLSDVFNGLMILPNILTLFLLSKYVFEETKKTDL